MKVPDSSTDDFQRCRHLLASLSGAAASVHCFHGRWFAVAAILGRLSTALDDIAAGTIADHQLTAELLCSLSQTLTVTLGLAEQCYSSEPPAGKLRTQSDVAAASAALHQLAADADLLLRSGALVDAEATGEAQNGGSAAHRESVRAKVRRLVTRLQIGTSVSRLAALDALLALLREDDKNVVIAAAQGVIPALLRLFDSAGGSGCVSSHEVREMAVAAIAQFAAVESCSHLLVAEGVALLNHLVRILEAEGSAAKEKACAALKTLTIVKDNAISVGSRGGVAALLEICSAGTPAAQAAAAGVLKNLAAVPELQQNFLDENGVPVLIRILASGTPLAQEHAVGCLCYLSASDDETQSLKLQIFNDGALGCLKEYWERGGAGDRNVESVVGLLRNLASFRYIAEIIATAGFLPPIVATMDGSISGARTEAARAIAALSITVGKARKEMGEALPKLVRMLEAKAAEEKEAAAMALASLMSFTAYRRLFRREEKGIVNVVQLLDPLVRNVDKKYVISILVSLSQSRKCMNQMVGAGACGFLQRLAVMEVDGAKRLLEILGGGRILGVFPRT